MDEPTKDLRLSLYTRHTHLRTYTQKPRLQEYTQHEQGVGKFLHLVILYVYNFINKTHSLSKELPRVGGHIIFPSTETEKSSFGLNRVSVQILTDPSDRGYSREGRTGVFRLVQGTGGVRVTMFLMTRTRSRYPVSCHWKRQ